MIANTTRVKRAVRSASPASGTAHQPERRLFLFYGVRNSADHAFKALLEDLAQSHAAFTLAVLYGAPGPNDIATRDFQHAGFINVALLKRVLPHGRHQFYVCGPPAMMAALVPALADWGVPKNDIHFESFGPASSGYVRPEAGAAGTPLTKPFDVQFRRSRRTVAWTGIDASLLDTENADLARERRELADQPEAELHELTQIYVARGVEPLLARQVAEQMTAKDAFAAHSRDELGLSDHVVARPIQAALTSALTFTVGAAVPLAIALLAPATSTAIVVSAGSLLCLAGLGAIGARIGGAAIFKPTVRVTFWGAFAMAATAAIGALVGRSV